MTINSMSRSLAAVILCLPLLLNAAEVKLGFEIAVEGDGVFWNPVVRRIDVTSVAADSLAARAGMLKGDEIVTLEGQPVQGRKASELRPYLKLAPGETRTIGVRHGSGEMHSARLTRPVE